MLRAPLVSLVVVLGLSPSVARAEVVEPPEIAPSFPGLEVVHPGDSCGLLVSGVVVAGDVDRITLTLPFASEQTVVDLDITSATGESVLLVRLPDGRVMFSSRDNNNSSDNLCGSGATSVPVGNRRDSAVNLGPTNYGDVLEVSVAGYADYGFTGAHGQAFTYELWVAVVPVGECVIDEDCDDGVDCTADLCNPETQGCEYLPDHDFCDNGLVCDGAERCDVNDGCLAGDAPDCDDGIECTLDGCDEAGGGCSHQPDHFFCDNGLACDGAEQCSPVEGCLGGAALPCDDGIDCTVDSCDEETASCLHRPDHGFCDDGDPCNGRELCHPRIGCREGKKPCVNCPPNFVCPVFDGDFTPVLLPGKPWHDLRRQGQPHPRLNKTR